MRNAIQGNDLNTAVAVTQGNFLCNLQRNDNESIARQVAENMLHAATCVATLQKVEVHACLRYLQLAKQFFIASQVAKRVCCMCNFVLNLCCNRTALQVAVKNCLVKKPFIADLLQPKAA